MTFQKAFQKNCIIHQHYTPAPDSGTAGDANRGKLSKPEFMGQQM